MDARPVPGEWAFAHAPGYVIIQVSNCVHDAVYFIEPEAIEPFIKGLEINRDAALALREQKRLEVPPGVILGQDGQPLRVVPPSPEGAEHEAKLRAVGEGHVGEPTRPAMETLPCHNDRPHGPHPWKLLDQPERLCNGVAPEPPSPLEADEGSESDE